VMFAIHRPATQPDEPSQRLPELISKKLMEKKEVAFRSAPRCCHQQVLEFVLPEFREGRSAVPNCVITVWNYH
jgi:hypothetical protein